MRVGAIRVTVLHGPAGSGKSTSLQQIMAAFQGQDWTTAWLSLDDADNDPRRFEEHVHAIVDSLHAGPPDAARPDRTPDHASLAEWVAAALARSATPVALFFDDFQVLRDGSILQFFRDLLRRLPGKSRVFIGSRSLPEIGLATLLVNGVATVLRVEELRFSAAESSEFFASSDGLDMSVTEVDAIHQRTEGWPAGLQLFRLALAKPGLRASLEELTGHGPRELAEYLSDNVVAMQAPAVQEFLLRTSLLRRLSGPLCDEVLGRTGSQAVLQHLERSGLFLVALDATNQWFRYHGLFATFLADSLQRDDPDSVALVHGRAARWHMAQGSYEEVLHHATEARNHALALDALNAWSSRLIGSAQLVTVERWYDRLPLEDVASRPDLAIKVAWALIFLRSSAKLRPLLVQLSRLRGQGDVATTTNPDIVLAMAVTFEDDVRKAAAIADKPEVYRPDEAGFPAFELGAAANLLAFAKVGEGDFEAGRSLINLAHSHNQRAGSAFSGGYTSALEALAHVLQADVREALRSLATPSVSPRLDGSMASAAFVACQIWAAYEAGELDRVLRLAEQFQHDITRSAIPDFIVITLVSTSRAHQARGEPRKALQALEALDRIGFDSGWPRVVRVAEWERVRRALAAQDVARAVAISQRISPAPAADGPWFPVSDLLEGQRIGQIRLAIHQGELALAAEMLVLAGAIKPERPLLRIKLLVLEALLQQRRGQPNAALRVLRRALDAARPGGCVRAFLDEGEVIVDMLQQEQQALGPAADPAVPDGGMRDFLQHLLQAAGIDPGAPARPALPGHVEPLSEREIEILRSVCEGASNRDMATLLSVSENTVKFHLKNIYAKLGVGNRAQTINVARRLRLIG